jgi:membrane protein
VRPRDGDPRGVARLLAGPLAPERLRRGADLTSRAAQSAGSGFLDDACTKLAAAMTYYALLSMFPLAILVVAGFGLVIAEGEARAQVIDTILDALPLEDGQGRAELARLLDAVTAGAEVSGALGVAGLLYSATGLMSAVRFSLTASGIRPIHGPCCAARRSTCS